MGQAAGAGALAVASRAWVRCMAAYLRESARDMSEGLVDVYDVLLQRSSCSRQVSLVRGLPAPRAACRPIKCVPCCMGAEDTIRGPHVCAAVGLRSVATTGMVGLWRLETGIAPGPVDSSSVDPEPGIYYLFIYLFIGCPSRPCDGYVAYNYTYKYFGLSLSENPADCRTCIITSLMSYRSYSGCSATNLLADAMRPPGLVLTYKCAPVHPDRLYEGGGMAN